uniref:Sulfotransferase domain-containing protein n=1 Tax=Alexandrium catenella TaxID=2925 RepID=A0A7S1QXB7_ALECA|mmetsp:Transcript_40313/g.108968  ORF Transcript_40313/g.108968 Transcript_40313/m.108968 type:complete len:325 (+) Transcript_40313:68-1042(+)
MALWATLLAAACLQANGLRRGSEALSVGDVDPQADDVLDDFDLYTDLSVYKDGEGRQQALRKPKASAARLPSAPGPEKILFLTHHKTGTFLMRQMASSLEATLGMEVQLRIQNRRTHPCNFSAQVAHYQNFHEEDLEIIRRDCPNYRAVHLIRSPLSLLASAYMYHRNTPDTFGMPTGPKKLTGLSVYDGLRLESEAIMYKRPTQRGVLREMLAVHELVKDDPRVLETDLDSFAQDFDGTTRRVFTHLLEEGHPAVDWLVRVNKEADVGRWTPERLAKNNHVHEKTMKHVVSKAVTELLRIGDPSVLSVLSYSEPLGYENVTVL